MGGLTPVAGCGILSGSLTILYPASDGKVGGPLAAKRRYVQVGMGGRAAMFVDALAGSHKEYGELLAMCDVNQTRMDLYNTKRRDADLAPLPTYKAEAFDEMVKRHKPDGVIVTTKDCFHHQYIVRAMELGCDAITEKPMTMDAEKCQAILDAVERTGRKLTVTFNYRYAPPRSQVKRLLMDGVVGEMRSVDFHWMLDTTHGADYFRRWHRDRANSGGLLVHKATHHFDLVNWWIDSGPETVFAFGRLGFYGPQHGEDRERCHTCDLTESCEFHLNMADSKGMRELYLDAEHEDGYFRDRCVFGQGIRIEDAMSLAVRYDSGVLMSYSLVAFSPYEGFKITFSGTKGRLEMEELEASYISAHDGEIKRATPESSVKITVFPHFKPAYSVDPQLGHGGHGGGDVKLLDDVFLDERPADPLGRAANHLDGARSIMTGIAANQSIATGQPIRIADVIRWPK